MSVTLDLSRARAPAATVKPNLSGLTRKALAEALVEAGVARPQIVLSREAERDLDALFDWIAIDSGVDRASAILRRLEETLDLLAATPRIGRVRHDLDGQPRTFSVWPWVIVYEPLVSGTGVAVWRIVDGRRDLPQII